MRRLSKTTIYQTLLKVSQVPDHSLVYTKSSLKYPGQERPLRKRDPLVKQRMKGEYSLIFMGVNL